MEFFYLLPLILILCVGVIGTRRILKGYYRIGILREFANSLNLLYRKAKDRSFEWEYPGFDFLKKGDNRHAFNVISGQRNGFEVKGFDYHYEIELDDHDTTLHFNFSVAITTSPFKLKPLIIRPECMVDKMAAAFGWDDIDFESAEFSRNYHVKAEDRRWAYDVLSPMVIDYLLQFPRYEVQMSHQHLAVRGKGQFDPEDFKKAFEIGETLLNGIPEFAKP